MLHVKTTETVTFKVATIENNEAITDHELKRVVSMLGSGDFVIDASNKYIIDVGGDTPKVLYSLYHQTTSNVVEHDY